MVTAEAATTLPVLLLLTMAGVAAVGVAQARIRCADAAGEAARAVARGDPGAADRARSAAGGPVAISVVTSATDTRVTARLALRPVRWLPVVSVTETAVVATEPGVSS